MEVVAGFAGGDLALGRTGVALGVKVLGGVLFTLDSSKVGIQGLDSGSSKEGWESKVVVWVSFLN